MIPRLLVPVLILLSTLTVSNDPPIVFDDITVASGLSTALAGMMGHAAAWGDVDRDGLHDLFVGGFCDRPDSEYSPATGPVPAKLFRNLGNGKFQQIKNSQTEFRARTSGALFVDLNEDGFPELYVANNSLGSAKISNPAQATAQTMLSKLFKNEKSMLQDICKSSAACPPDLQTARSIGVLDYNNDRLLDLLIVEDKFKRKKQKPRSVLLKNTGNLTFRNANFEANLPDDIYGFGVAIADLNEDSAPDFFVSHSNRLFLSVAGNKYREATDLKPVFEWNPLDSEDWPCGVAFGDLNKDGLLDLVLTAHHDPARNRIYINRGLRNGIPQFQNVTDKTGLAQNVPAKSPHVEIQDFDNDSLPDIYISAAWKDGEKVIPLIYRNQGIQKDGLPNFKPVREIIAPMIYFPSGPTADFNGDGKLDIFLVNWFRGNTSHLLNNRTRTGNWLRVKAPIGSKIKLFSSGKLMGYQQLYIGYGYASGQVPICHFGVGNLNRVDLEITVPGRASKRENNVAVNRVLEF
ncbi:CRTAC1 family protein [bacterium]|nr:CRTAC1 family protein [bacterium]MCI0606642.1 CRTAC1 family protein [bacterium]